MTLKNISRSLATIVALTALTLSPQAQTFNLVPNSGFEDTNIKKLRSYGQMEDVSKDWFSATEVKADVYGDGAKGDKIGIPTNDYGTQEPAAGLCYAGFRAYSKDPRMQRSYLEVKLPQMLDRDVMYCVSFDISLADLSRYAVNDIGVVVSDRKIEQPNLGDMILQPDVKQKTNKVFQFAEGWEKFCGTFVGTGQEEYIVIGCFGSRSDMSIEKVKRPMGLTGPQLSHAYYYIDNVEIIEIQAKSQCVCSAVEERDMDLVYGSSSVQDEDMTDVEKINASAIYYAFLKRTPTGSGKQTVADIATILKANPSMRINIVGHCDDDEASEGKINARYKMIGKNRGDQIRRMLEAAGVPASQFSVSDIGAQDPANSRDTDISRAQNRRVTFEVN
ncbi:MAG: OmpA family protein [Flavobacteriales bacterium]|nr:OmpA family protein [Flavobacteriales bacterium]